MYAFFARKRRRVVGARLLMVESGVPAEGWISTLAGAVHVFRPSHDAQLHHASLAHHGCHPPFTPLEYVAEDQVFRSTRNEPGCLIDYRVELDCASLLPKARAEERQLRRALDRAQRVAAFDAAFRRGQMLDVVALYLGLPESTAQPKTLS